VNNKIKKPPIKISELNKHEEDEHKRGDLTYIGGDEEKEKGKGKFTLQGLPQILLSSVISISIAAFLIFQLAPGKGDFRTLEDELAGLSGVVTGLEGKSGSTIGRLEAMIATMGEYTKKTELGGYATKSELDATKSEVAALAGLPSGLDSKFATLSTSLDAKLAALEARIKALEEEEAAAPSGEDITASLSSSYLFIPKDNTPGTIFIKLTNDSSRDVEIKELDLVLFPSQPGGTPNFASLTVSSNLILSWQVVSLGNDIFLVQGRPMPYIGGPRVEADDSESYLVTFKFTLKVDVTLPEEGLSLGVKIDGLSYDVLE